MKKNAIGFPTWAEVVRLNEVGDGARRDPTPSSHRWRPAPDGCLRRFGASKLTGGSYDGDWHFSVSIGAKILTLVIF